MRSTVDRLAISAARTGRPTARNTQSLGRVTERMLARLVCAAPGLSYGAATLMTSRRPIATVDLNESGAYRRKMN